MPPAPAPCPPSPNHITLSDMGTQDQTHTASFCSCLSVHINSCSSTALTCLKLHLWIIDHLLPERPQCGIMRIKTRAEKAEWEKCKRVEQRRRADTGLIPLQDKNPLKHLFCHGMRLLCGMTTQDIVVEHVCVCVCVFSKARCLNGFPA